MLKPNVIPDKEPVLFVGIILPEDRFTNIDIEVPDSPLYKLIFGESEEKCLEKGDRLEFEINHETISLEINEQQAIESAAWRIEPIDSKSVMANKTGLEVKEVVVGRGFHWVKNIDVYLPGAVEISVIDSNLVVANELPIEQYLMCVATSEMGAECPPAFIESQTIIARSWMLANIEMKHANIGLDVCNDDCCQRYQGTTFLSDEAIRGALNTFGKVLLCDDKICDTRYFKSCGGITESFENVFGDEPISYLKSIVDAPGQFYHEALPLDSENSVRKWIKDTPESYCSTHVVPESELIKYLGNVDVEGEYFRWNFRYTQKEITALLNLKLDIDAAAILAIRPVKRGYSGRLIKVQVDYRHIDGQQESVIVEDQYVIRQTFHELFLYSSAFVIDIEKGSEDIPAAFILKGAGWGHGVGYCQIGAIGMSLKGFSAEEIVQHYYPGSTLKKIY